MFYFWPRQAFGASNALSLTRLHQNNTFAINKSFNLALKSGLASFRRSFTLFWPTRGSNGLSSLTRSISTYARLCSPGRRGFTPEEDQYITGRRREGASYAEIAAHINRKAGSVRERHVTKLAPKSLGRPVSASILKFGEELEILRSAGKTWRDIAATLGRLEASVRKTYSRYLILKRLGHAEWAAVREAAGRRYTAEDDEMLSRLKDAGLDWAEISAVMKRSPRACESRYYCQFVRGARERKSAAETAATEYASTIPDYGKAERPSSAELDSTVAANDSARSAKSSKT